MKAFADMVAKELARARSKHGNCNSLHEGYAIILEETDEFKEEVWKKTEERDAQNMLTELIQIAAMAQKVAEDTGLIQ